MAGKTHLIQARPKDLCFSLHAPFIHGGRLLRLELALVFPEEERVFFRPQLAPMVYERG